METGISSEISILIKDIHVLIKQSIRESHAPFFTTPQIMVLSTLSKHGSMKITELGEKLNLANSTVSGIVDRLEKQDFVNRFRGEEDRRVVKVALSDKFKLLHSEMHKTIESNIEQRLMKADKDEIQLILTGLKTLKRLLE